MIERKDVRHEIRSQEHIHCDEVCSVLFFSISTFIDEAEQRQARYEIIPEAQRRNEEAVRRKLYGDVVDELHGLHQRMFREGISRYEIGMAIERIISKLEWKDGLDG